MKLFDLCLIPLYLIAWIVGYIVRPILIGYHTGLHSIDTRERERAEEIMEERVKAATQEEMDKFEQLQGSAEEPHILQLFSNVPKELEETK